MKALLGLECFLIWLIRKEVSFCVCFFLILGFLDGSGGISKEEFKGLLNKLDISLSDHRIGEIFAKSIKKSSKNQEELDIKGN